MLGASFRTGGQAQHVVRIDSRCGDDVGDLRLASGDGSGLVQNHDAHPACPLQGLAGLEENALRGPLARAHQDRRRRRQADGTRTGDDQHRHGVHQCLGPRHIRDIDPPNECEERKRQDDRNEVPANLVRQLLDRRLAGLCFLDEAHDLRKHRVSAHLRRL